MRPVAAAARDYLERRIALQRSNEDDLRAPPAHLWKPIIAALNAALLAYAHPQNWQGGKPVEPLPAELAHVIADLAFSEPLVGRAPPVLTALIQPHRTEPPSLQSDRRAAVQFIAAARAGFIETSDPQKDVRCAFGIPRQTLQRWLKDMEPQPLPEPPPEEDREAWRGVTASILRIAMEKAGEHYRAFRHVKARLPAKPGALRASRARHPAH